MTWVVVASPSGSESIKRANPEYVKNAAHLSNHENKIILVHVNVEFGGRDPQLKVPGIHRVPIWVIVRHYLLLGVLVVGE